VLHAVCKRIFKQEGFLERTNVKIILKEHGESQQLVIFKIILSISLFYFYGFLEFY